MQQTFCLGSLQSSSVSQLVDSRLEHIEDPIFIISQGEPDGGLLIGVAELGESHDDFRNLGFEKVLFVDLVDSRVLLCSRDLFLHLKLVSKRLFTHAHATESLIVCFLDPCVHSHSLIARFHRFAAQNDVASTLGPVFEC